MSITHVDCTTLVHCCYKPYGL